MLSMILPLITSPYISRVLGPENVGIYSYTYSIANYFVLIAMLGFKNYGIRCVAKVRDNKEKLSREFWSIWGTSGNYFKYNVCDLSDLFNCISSKVLEYSGIAGDLCFLSNE